MGLSVCACVYVCFFMFGGANNNNNNNNEDNNGVGIGYLYESTVFYPWIASATKSKRWPKNIRSYSAPRFPNHVFLKTNYDDTMEWLEQKASPFGSNCQGDATRGCSGIALQHNQDKTRKTKGAIVILAQNRHHPTYGRNSNAMLKKTLDNIYKFYNNKQKDDIIIFHEGDFQNPHDQEDVQNGRAEIRFVALSGADWEVYPPSIIGTENSWSAEVHIGYRHMIRFYAVRIWQIMANLGYDYVCRFDDDSYLLSEIPYNLFDHMQEHGYDYAYRNTAMESGWSGTKWWRWHQPYISSMEQKFNGTASSRPAWLLQQCEKCKIFSIKCCGSWFKGFYNNFFVANVSRFLEPDIQDYLATMDESGRMYTLRWNDLIIQSMAVQLFIPQHKVHRFRDFSYAHNSGKPENGIQWGIVQVSNRIENQREEMDRILVQELDWADARQANKKDADSQFGYVEGMYTYRRPFYFLG
mmetsp:Transcript_6932/g.10594  ORF Transcript_6932/g.10594 Transcript_6932/m.10594 type:complete len:468 (+) Transcript_6932:2-1405(+)